MADVNENGEGQAQGTPPEAGNVGQSDQAQEQINELLESNRQTQEYLRNLTEENRLLREMVTTGQQTQEDLSLEDDFFETEERDKLQELIQHELKKEINPVVDSLQRQRIESQEREFRKSHPDYDEVTVYTTELIKKNPALGQAIYNAEDSAAMAYNIGLGNPARIQQQQNPPAGQAPQTLAGMNGGVHIPGSNDEVKKIQSESVEAFKARTDAIRNMPRKT